MKRVLIAIVPLLAASLTACGQDEVTDSPGLLPTNGSRPSAAPNTSSPTSAPTDDALNNILAKLQVFEQRVIALEDQVAPTGTITGRVGDDVGAHPGLVPVAGVIVNIPGTDLMTTSDSAGRFAIERVPIGVWAVTLSRETLFGDTPQICIALIVNLRIAEAGQVLEIPGVTVAPQPGRDASLCATFPAGHQ